VKRHVLEGTIPFTRCAVDASNVTGCPNIAVMPVEINADAH
jgi:hypothetical protein